MKISESKRNKEQKKAEVAITEHPQSMKTEASKFLSIGQKGRQAQRYGRIY